MSSRDFLSRIFSDRFKCVSRIFPTKQNISSNFVQYFSQQNFSLWQFLLQVRSPPHEFASERIRGLQKLLESNFCQMSDPVFDEYVWCSLEQTTLWTEPRHQLSVGENAPVRALPPAIRNKLQDTLGTVKAEVKGEGKVLYHLEPMEFGIKVCTQPVHAIFCKRSVFQLQAGIVF